MADGEVGIPDSSCYEASWATAVRSMAEKHDRGLMIEPHQFRALLMAIVCGGGNVGTRTASTIADAILRECNQ